MSSAICEYLFAHELDVRETVVVADVVDKNVGGGVAQTVATVVGPLLQGRRREVTDRRTVGQS